MAKKKKEEVIEEIADPKEEQPIAEEQKVEEVKDGSEKDGREEGEAEMDEEEEKIMTIFDALCFKGSTTHLKKLRGIKLFPLERLFRCRNIIDLDGFVQKMVLKRFGENN